MIKSSLRIAQRMITEVSPRALYRASVFGFKGMRAVQKYNRRVRQGKQFPAFMMISVTNRCNLRCQGCWVTPTPPTDMEPAILEQIIRACMSQGSYFFGLLGGEPLIHKGLLDVVAKFPQAYFQLFTNGHHLDASVARTLRRLGNVTPLISIEGLEHVADVRRGAENVAVRSLAAIEHCHREKLLVGVATSVCQSNYQQVKQRDFLIDMAQRGVHYVWYYIYRPVGPDPNPVLCLTVEQLQSLRRFLVDARVWAPVIVVDAYWDAQGQAVCPAAMGISYHITPSGFVEPCPIVQSSSDKYDGSLSLVDMIEQSTFLPRFRRFAAERTRGCILMDDPHALAEFVQNENALDSSGRDCFISELRAMSPRPSHACAPEPIPERNLLYRFAKKHWFFGFGAYA